MNLSWYEPLNIITNLRILNILKEGDFEFKQTLENDYVFSYIYTKSFKEFNLGLKYWIRYFKKNKIEIFFVDYNCLQKIFLNNWKIIKLKKRKIDNIKSFCFYKYLNTIFIYEETNEFREFPVLQNQYLSRNYLRYITQDLNELNKRSLRWNNSNDNHFISNESKQLFYKSLGLAFTYDWTKDSSFRNITWKNDLNQINNDDLISVVVNNIIIFEFFATPYGVLIWKELNKSNNVTKILECYEYDYNKCSIII